MQETQVGFLGREDPPGKDTVNHSSILPAESHGQRSLAGYSSLGHRESDTNELLSLNIHIWRLKVTDGCDISCLLLLPEILSFQTTPGALWSGRSPGGGHGNPLQCSCLENPTDRGAWWATVHGVAKESDVTAT